MPQHAPVPLHAQRQYPQPGSGSAIIATPSLPNANLYALLKVIPGTPSDSRV